MFEHLFHNACGEHQVWQALFAGLFALPLVGPALLSLLRRFRKLP